MDKIRSHAKRRKGITVTGLDELELTAKSLEGVGQFGAPAKKKNEEMDVKGKVFAPSKENMQSE